MKLKKFFIYIILFVFCINCNAQDTIPIIHERVNENNVNLELYKNHDLNVDSTIVYKKINNNEIDLKFHFNQLIVPASLITIGTIGYYSKAFHKLNRHIQKGMSDLRGDHYFRHDDWIQYVPAASYLALGFYKNKRKLDFKERILVEATAYLSMTAIVNVAKYSFKEKRPDSSARNSFPSGHTATAFTGAELIRAEFGWGIGSVAYVVSTGVAFLRLYNNRHWFNDILAGAGIGILSARIGFWMLPLYRKWFHWDKSDQMSSLIFSPAISTSQLSLNMLYTF